MMPVSDFLEKFTLKQSTELKQYTVRVETFVTFVAREGLTEDDISINSSPYVKRNTGEFERKEPIEEETTSKQIQSTVDI